MHMLRSRRKTPAGGLVLAGMERVLRFAPDAGIARPRRSGSRSPVYRSVVRTRGVPAAHGARRAGQERGVSGTSPSRGFFRHLVPISGNHAQGGRAISFNIHNRDLGWNADPACRLPVRSSVRAYRSRGVQHRRRWRRLSRRCGHAGGVRQQEYVCVLHGHAAVDSVKRTFRPAAASGRSRHSGGLAIHRAGMFEGCAIRRRYRLFGARRRSLLCCDGDCEATRNRAFSGLGGSVCRRRRGDNFVCHSGRRPRRAPQLARKRRDIDGAHLSLGTRGRLYRSCTASGARLSGVLANRPFGG